MQVGNLFYQGKMQTQMAVSDLCILFLKLYKHAIRTQVFVVSVLYTYKYPIQGTGLCPHPT